jgi:rfaE bifunctional protein nucleotidyltransferase chain/domain
MKSLFDKIIKIEDFLNLQKNGLFDSKKIVFTNGCFDVIHAGHVSYLSEAKTLGNLLIIGLNSDSSVKRLKGDLRPINNEKDRALVLSAMSFVDFIITFETDTPIDLIQKIKPNVLVKGGDWKIEDIVGSDIVLNNGGEVRSLSFCEGKSSTNIINRMSDVQ